jgi:hypothetical protein
MRESLLLAALVVRSIHHEKSIKTPDTPRLTRRKGPVVEATSLASMTVQASSGATAQ